jgi:GntR family transcriptional regulator
MRIAVDPRSPVPLHAQIAEGIGLVIARGELSAGDRLPTVRQLAVDLRVNSNTVARVYAELERAGVLEARRGQGTFVRGPARIGEHAGRRRLAALCRAFVRECSRQGFTLEEIRRALRALAAGKDGEA